MASRKVAMTDYTALETLLFGPDFNHPDRVLGLGENRAP
jgi:hypothetical protein